MSLQVLCVCLAAFASWLLLRSLIPQLRRRLLDQPNARSSHRLPTPRGGGVVFVVVAVAASVVNLLQAHWSGPQTMAAVASPLPALQLAALSMLALPLALVGFADDRHNLPAGWRYGAQLATALVLLLISPLVNRLSAVVELPTSAVHLLSVPLLSALVLLVAPLLLLLVAVTAVINFTNFMDGLDGLVAGCMAVALAALAIELAAPLSIWALVGAVLGFLIWNWSPAKVFMGDVGSTFLGAVFAGLVLQAPSWPEALAMLLVATPLLADACLCVPRRLLAGQRVFQAHRLHLFQRLHQAGWTHALVSSLYIAATVVLAMALLWGGWPWVIALASFVLLIGVWLDQQVAVPFAVASRS